MSIQSYTANLWPFQSQPTFSEPCEDLDFEGALQRFEQTPPQTALDLSSRLAEIDHMMEQLYQIIQITRNPGPVELEFVDRIEKLFHAFGNHADIQDAQIKFYSFKNWVLFLSQYQPISQFLEERVCDLNDYTLSLEISRAPLSLNCSLALLKGCLDLLAIFQKYSPKIENSTFRAELLKVLHEDLRMAIDAHEQFWAEYSAALCAETAEAQAHFRQSPSIDNQLILKYLQQKFHEMVHSYRDLYDRFPKELFQNPRHDSSWRSTLASIGQYIRSPSTLFISSSKENAEKAAHRLFHLYRQFLNVIKDAGAGHDLSDSSANFSDHQFVQIALSRKIISAEMLHRQNRQNQTKTERQRESPLWKQRLLGLMVIGLHGGAAAWDVFRTTRFQQFPATCSLLSQKDQSTLALSHAQNRSSSHVSCEEKTAIALKNIQECPAGEELVREVSTVGRVLVNCVQSEEAPFGAACDTESRVIFISDQNLDHRLATFAEDQAVQESSGHTSAYRIQWYDHCLVKAPKEAERLRQRWLIEKMKKFWWESWLENEHQALGDALRNQGFL